MATLASNPYQTPEAAHARVHALMLETAPLVKRIAHHLLMRLPSHIEVDDLIQAGMIGLAEAAGKFDGSKGATFSTYAGIRIRGAMLDEIRRLGWAPRSVHRKAREIAEMIAEIERETGGAASESDVAARLGITLDDYHATLADVSGSRLFSYDELADPDDDAGFSMGAIASGDLSPEQNNEKAAFTKALATQIDKLPEREKLVLALYYQEELNLKEIGEVLGVTESRVSQIHSQAAARLRGRLSMWNEQS
ncbi:MAG: RNA polymerase sigma factor FliA [Litorivicinus sp.]